MADRKTLYTPLGVSGLPRYSGYVFDEWLHELQGPRGRRVLREMGDNSAPIGAIKFAMEHLIRRVSWTVAPGKDDDAGHEAALFVEECMHDMEVPWEDILADILTMFDYGWSLFEVVFKRRDDKASKFGDGRIGWQGWQMRGQETLLHWDYEDFHSNFPKAFVQLGAPDWIEHTIPMDRCLLFRTTTRRANPEGRSLWRNAYHSWYMQKHLEAIEAIGAERDMAGLPVGLVPGELLLPDASPSEKQQAQNWKDLVTNIRRDEQEGVLIPSDRDESGNLEYDLKLLSTGGQRQFNLGDVIERHEQRMLMTCLGDFIMLGHTNVGTQSLGKTKIELFSSAISAYLSLVSAQINDKAIPQLLRLNGMDHRDPPTLHHGQVERMDLDTLGNYLYQLGQAGIVFDTNPQGALTAFLMEQGGMPPPPEGLEIPFPYQWQQLMPNPEGLPPTPGNAAQAPFGTQPPAAPAVPGATAQTPGSNPPNMPAQLMSPGVNRPSIKQPNRPKAPRPEPPRVKRGPLQKDGAIAREARNERRRTTATEEQEYALGLNAVTQLSEVKGLKVVAFDLDNTALRFPQVFVPLAQALAEKGVEIGVLTGNGTAAAHQMWEDLEYPKAEFYMVHPEMDNESIAQWKAGQCKKLGVDVLIDDFSGGRGIGIFRSYIDSEGAATIPLEVVIPPNDPNYQHVGRNGGGGGDGSSASTT